MSQLSFFCNFLAAGQNYIKQQFNICGSMTAPSDLQNLKNWITGAWSNIAMVEYPYPANFIQNLPAWPIKVSSIKDCEK
mgnify:CR=1 FL=1